MEQINKIIGMTTSEQYYDDVKKVMQQKCARMNEVKGDLNKYDGYDCPLCLNRGGTYEVREYDGRYYETFVHCKCQRVRKAIRRLNKSGLKDAVKKYTFDNFTTAEEWQAKIKDEALDYIENGYNRWFYLGGQSGAGKSHLCTAIAIKLLKQGYDTRYMLWRDEAAKLKSLVNDTEEYEKMINEIKNADVLYIDDLFKTGKANNGKAQKPTPADINLAFEILNYRYNKNLPYTIISSECTLSDLIKIDEAVSGRIAEKALNSGNWCLSIRPDTAKNYRFKGVTEL